MNNTAGAVAAEPTAIGGRAGHLGPPGPARGLGNFQPSRPKRRGNGRRVLGAVVGGGHPVWRGRWAHANDKIPVRQLRPVLQLPTTPSPIGNPATIPHAGRRRLLLLTTAPPPAVLATPSAHRTRTRDYRYVRGPCPVRQWSLQRTDHRLGPDQMNLKTLGSPLHRERPSRSAACATADALVPPPPPPAQ